MDCLAKAASPRFHFTTRLLSLLSLSALFALSGCPKAQTTPNGDSSAGDSSASDTSDTESTSSTTTTSQETDTATEDSSTTDSQTTEMESSDPGSDESTTDTSNTPNTDSESESQTGSETTETESDSETTTTSDTSTGSDDACAGDQPVVRIATSMGDMEITLDRVNAPKTVANFLSYAQMGSYDNTIFHRVIKGFVIQGGGFLTGGETAVETMPPIELEISPDLRHVDGAISMARLGSGNDSDTPDELNSADSQFFICDGAQAFLDDNYAAFGVLTAGVDILRAIAAVKVDMELPAEEVLVKSVSCVGY